jgi:hypothetical protein
LSINDDFSTYCFACATFTPSDQSIYTETSMPPETIIVKDMTSFLESYNNGVSTSISDRKLSKDTVERYGVVRSDGNYLFPYYDKDSSLCGAKVRSIKDKVFSTIGNFSAGTLFGQNIFPSGGKYVTITEGEFDALAVYQLTGSKYPAVSIRIALKTLSSALMVTSRVRKHQRKLLSCLAVRLRCLNPCPNTKTHVTGSLMVKAQRSFLVGGPVKASSLMAL